MAITPFTQPVQQSKFIPGQSRLPMQSIAQATGQLVRRDVRNRDMIDQMEQSLRQQIGDNEALSPVMDRYRKEIEDVASNRRYYDDTRRIKRLAGEAKRDIGLVRQHQKNLQEQKKKIQDLEGMNQARKNQLFNFAASNAQLGVTDQGRVNPDTVFSPREFGEEADRFEVGLDALNKLKSETIQSKSLEGVNQLGLAEFFEQSGVTPRRIKDAVMESYKTNPGVQNWRNQSVDMRTQQYVNSGMSPEEAREKAEEVVQLQLENTAGKLANEYSYIRKDRSQRSIPDSARGEFGGGDTTRSKGVPIGVDTAFNPAQKKELLEIQNRVYNETMESKLGDDYEDYRSLRRQAYREFETLTPEEKRDAAVYLPQEERGKRSRSRLDVSTKEDYFQAMLLKNNRPLYDKWHEANEAANQAINSKLVDYVPYEHNLQDTDDDKVAGALRTIRSGYATQFDSGDVSAISNDLVDNWFQDADADQRRAVVKSTLRNADNIAVSEDGTYLKLTVGNLSGEDIQGIDKTKLEGENIRVSTKGMSRDTLSDLLNTAPKDTRQTILRNFEYQDTPVLTTEWTETPKGLEVKRAEDLTGFQLRRKNGNPVTYRHLLKSTQDDQIKNRMLESAYLRSQQLDEYKDKFNSYRDFIQKYKNKNNKVLNLIGESAIIPHKGDAFEFSIE